MSRFASLPFNINDDPRKQPVSALPLLPQGPSAGINPFSSRGLALHNNLNRSTNEAARLQSLNAQKPYLVSTPRTGTASATLEDGSQVNFEKQYGATFGGGPISPQAQALRNQSIADHQANAKRITDGMYGENYSFNRGMLTDENNRVNATTAANNSLTGAKTGAINAYGSNLGQLMQAEGAERNANAGYQQAKMKTEDSMRMPSWFNVANAMGTAWNQYQQGRLANQGQAIQNRTNEQMQPAAVRAANNAADAIPSAAQNEQLGKIRSAEIDNLRTLNAGGQRSGGSEGAMGTLSQPDSYDRRLGLFDRAQKMFPNDPERAKKYFQELQMMMGTAQPQPTGEIRQTPQKAPQYGYSFFGIK